MLVVCRWRQWPLSHLRGGEGWPEWWVRRWLVRPILAQNSLRQWGQGIVAAAAPLVLSFLACLLVLLQAACWLHSSRRPFGLRPPTHTWLVLQLPMNQGWYWMPWRRPLGCPYITILGHHGHVSTTFSRWLLMVMSGSTYGLPSDVCLTDALLRSSLCW